MPRGIRAAGNGDTGRLRDHRFALATCLGGRAGQARRRCAADVAQFPARSRSDVGTAEPRPGKGGPDRAADRQGRVHLRRLGRPSRARGKGGPYLGGPRVLRPRHRERWLPGGPRSVGSRHPRDDRQGLELAHVELVQGRRRCERRRRTGGCRREVDGDCRPRRIHACKGRLRRGQSRWHRRACQHPLERRLLRRHERAAA